jgi:pyruvate dehydrogenase E2 component (dihydrolipoamide acetyltransferase)
MFEFVMPSLGADMESGTLIEWLVKPGDRVHRGDIIAVVETDKGAIDVEIFTEGVVAELLITPDTLVPVGTALARLTSGAETPTPAAPPRVAPAAPVAKPIPKVQPTVVVPAPPAEGSRRKISPAARMHAREHGIDLDAVVGSGPGGIVNVADVERAVHAAPLAATAAQAPAVSAPRRAAAVDTSAMRRAIAAAMSRSKREIPHYYLAHSIDLEPALRWMEQRNAERSLAQRLLYGALLIKAVARALVAAPALNGLWRNDAFEPSTVTNIGIIISLRGGGLVAPALRDVANTDLDAVMAGLRDLTGRARSGRLKSSELGAATITISSLGETGVETVFPVIHPPQVAIVGFGAVLPRPWVVDGGLYVHRVVHATLAADHRVSDGHVGAAFLGALERLLAKPEAL